MISLTISASHEDRATLSCFLDPHEMAALFRTNTRPEVEWRVAQLASLIPYRSRWRKLIEAVQITALGAEVQVDLVSTRRFTSTVTAFLFTRLRTDCNRLLYCL